MIGWLVSGTILLGNDRLKAYLLFWKVFYVELVSVRKKVKEAATNIKKYQHVMLLKSKAKIYTDQTIRYPAK